MFNPRNVQNTLHSEPPTPVEILTSQVLALLEPENGDGEVAQEYAVRQAVTLLEKVESLYSKPIPLAAVLPSYEGGVRLDWLYPNFSLTVVVPPDESGNGYIFHEHGTTYGTEPLLAEGLAGRLAWLNNLILTL